MPQVVHVVVTDNFAGTERYVCNVAAELAGRGWSVTVVGGNRGRMHAELGDRIRWLPGATPAQAVWSLSRLRGQDVCHAHLTFAEAVSLATRPAHGGAVVATRHFAARRGASRLGRVLAGPISRRLVRQYAVSDFVASHIELAPDAVIETGVPPSPLLWSDRSTTVLVMQRLEREKDTLTAIRAWQTSGLATAGWSLRIVGTGSERRMLQTWADENSVGEIEFVPWVEDISHEFARAGILLAPAPREPFGLVVVEAMAAGIPVVAAAGGGHLETVGMLPDAVLFSPGDASRAADALRMLTSVDKRACLSDGGRKLVEARFTLSRHVDRLVREYASLEAVS